MEANARLQPTARFAPRPIQLILVRANGPLFYSLATASLLEAAMPLAADRLLHFFGADRAISQWVNAEWLPRKLSRAAELRNYMSTVWPEFDWHASLEHYRTVGCGDGAVAPRRPTGAHEALARCVATAQSGIFYRSLARWAEDAKLRELARNIAQEEALSFNHFRDLYDRRLKAQGFGCGAAWTTALGCVRSARDGHVPRAFNAINAQCAVQVPFPVLEYPEFVSRMGAVIERHGNLGTPERLLFRAWKAHPRLPAPNGEQRALPWFRPVLKAAA